MSGASHAHIRRLEREVAALRELLHSSSSAHSAQRLVEEANARCEKRLKRARKKLLLAAHPDKTRGLDSKSISEYFTRVVQDLSKDFQT